jgi:CheY-like chemotaxis protein
LALINDVLDISKIEAERLELQNIDFDLTALIDGLSAMFAVRCQQEGLEWRVEWEAAGVLRQSSSPPPHLSVHGDEGKLRQVLINLLSNAVKFTHSGSVCLRITHDGLRMTFHVIDTGIGIAPENRAKIFEPFVQSGDDTNREGTGLGLSIAQKLIQLMGGELSLESEPGEDSSFFFTLPLPPAPQAAAVQQAETTRQISQLAAGYHVKALIADDMAENRDILSKILVDIGVSVESAENGQQAVEMVKANPPDIVFMDIRMPTMDGKQAAETIWEEFGHDAVKIVAFSASTLDHQKQAYLDFGFDAFISKPFLIEEIYGCLAELLGVEYHHTDSAEIVSEPPALEEISLPSDLVERMEAAAKLYSTTELKDCLIEAAQFGEDGARLAAYLQPFLDSYDMEGIISVLDRIQKC